MNRLAIALGIFAVSCVVSVACSDEDIGDAPADSGSDTGSGGTSGNGGGAGIGGGSGTGGSSGSSGSSGASGSGGSGGSGGDAAADADASGPTCLDAGSKYQLSWCSGMAMPITHTTGIVPPYLGKVHGDCRVAKLVDEHPQVFEFGNKLTTFTLTLWGCDGDGVDTFALVDQVSALSAADAKLLIDFYVQSTTLELSIPPSQQNELRNVLECLAQGAITNPSTTEHELSSCAPDAGVDAAADAEADAATDASEDAASDTGSQDGGND